MRVLFIVYDTYSHLSKLFWKMLPAKVEYLESNAECEKSKETHR